MYGEVLERLRDWPRICAQYDGSVDQLHDEAADAIEELTREAEEYKAAYRKEHNKRIAENRYLYDELTKAIKEKLLMTPMRIEVPQPPKEE